MTETLLEKLKLIKCVITDLDGVLTNGQLYLDNHGNELKSFHVHDGVGIKLLQSVGIQVGVITTSTCTLVELRMKQLGITHYHLGQKNKESAYKALLSDFQVRADEVLYIGDDIPDISLLQQSGVSATVMNAQEEVKTVCDYISGKKGGKGGVRDICNLLLNAKNLSSTAYENFLNG